MKKGLAFGAVLVAASAAAPAFAGPTEQRLAQALFDEARRLMDQKRFTEACPKLAESQRLDPGGGTLLNLAVCHAGEGKTATALVEYNEALAVATRDGRRDREELARSAIAKLEAEVPRIAVVVASAARVPGLAVKIDDTPLPSVAWDVPVPVDPGSHVVVATIPERPAWTTVVSVLPNERKTVEVPVLRSDAEAPPPAAPPPPVMKVEPSRNETPPSNAPGPTKHNPVHTAILIGTLSAGALAAVTGGLALSERSKADDACVLDRNWCHPGNGGDAAVSNSNTLAWVSTVSLVVMVAGAVALFIVPTRVADKRLGVLKFEATF